MDLASDFWAFYQEARVSLPPLEWPFVDYEPRIEQEGERVLLRFHPVHYTTALKPMSERIRAGEFRIKPIGGE